MLYAITFCLMLISMIVGVLNHRLAAVLAAVLPALFFAIKIIAGLALMMSLWIALVRIAQGLGWVSHITRWIKPVLRRLFPEIAPDDPAFDYIGLNLTANLLGMGNAATPFGIQAMKKLQRLNSTPAYPSDAMCLLLAINTSSIQLLPITGITVLAVGGAAHPFAVIIPTLLATSVSTLVGISTAKLFKHLPMFKVAA